MLLKDKLTDRRLILASASPRRRQILSDAGLPFTLAESYQVEEVWPENLPAEHVAKYLAELKSNAYPAPLAERDILLTADTIVVLNGRILGKPKDEEEAMQMLFALSGHVHEVITGIVLRTRDRRETFCDRSEVKFRRLTREEIEYYVDAFRPMDKAGAYAIQEWIGHVGIERIAGSFYNVMGLPIQMIYAELNKMV